MAVLFGRNAWKIWCHSVQVWSLSKSEEVKSHSCFQGKEILHSQRKSSKSSRKKADKTMLFIYFLVNRFNMFKYYYFMLHGQIGKYDVLACTKKNLGSLPFVIIISLLLTSQLRYWFVLIPWDTGSMHGVTTTLNCPYWLSMITVDQQGVYIPKCVSLVMYLVRADEGEGKWYNFYAIHTLLLHFSNTSAFSQSKAYQKSIVPWIVFSFFRLCKSFSVSCSPQAEISN